MRCIRWIGAPVCLAALGCGPALGDFADAGVSDRDLARPPVDAALGGDRPAPPDFATSADFSWRVPDLAFAAPDLALPACDHPSGMRHGLTMRSMMVAGLQRTYLVYLPTN